MLSGHRKCITVDQNSGMKIRNDIDPDHQSRIHGGTVRELSVTVSCYLHARSAAAHADTQRIIVPARLTRWSSGSRFDLQHGSSLQTRHRSDRPQAMHSMYRTIRNFCGGGNGMAWGAVIGKRCAARRDCCTTRFNQACAVKVTQRHRNQVTMRQGQIEKK
jgi:hypothetical protein